MTVMLMMLMIINHNMDNYIRVTVTNDVYDQNEKLKLTSHYNCCPDF